MAEFAVWAPYARRVQLQLNTVHRPIAMHVAGGMWRTEVEAAPGTRYQFVLDEGVPMPDPRSCFQPDGVHGESEVVDHDSFEWTDRNWKGLDLTSDVIYEMHVGTFTPDGTFDSAIERLEHLVELGVGAIELMPVVEFPGDHGWGYDGVSLYAPHHKYGGPNALKRMIDACHSRGIGVILDVVYNHLGPDGNYLAAYGPYFTQRHQTPWGDAMNFDGTDSRPVREFVLGNVDMWLDCYHVDGLRLDATHAIIVDSPVHMVTEIVEFAHAIGRRRGYPAWVIAENNWNDPIVVRSRANGGWGADAQWSDDFHHALQALITGERDGYYVDYGSINDIAKVLTDGYVYTGQESAFFGGPRGMPTDGIDGKRFVVCAQNHDQIGNRAKGERLSMLADPRLLDVAAALVILGPFVPMIFQGEEWAARTPFQYFTDHRDQTLAEAVIEGRKKEFERAGWGDEVPNPQDLLTFGNSKLDWAELEKPECARMFEWYKTLIRLRKEKTDFAGDDRSVQVDGDVLEMKRGAHKVIANFGDTPRTFDQVEVAPKSVHICK